MRRYQVLAQISLDIQVPQEMSLAYPTATPGQIGRMLANKIANITRPVGRPSRPKVHVVNQVSQVVQLDRNTMPVHTWKIYPPGHCANQAPKTLRIEVSAHYNCTKDHLANKLRTVIECFNF